MKRYHIAYWDNENNAVTEILTEDEIIEQYWDYWYGKMCSINKEGEATRERCIENWCIVNWAREVNED